ncbi:MAG: response regulator transcription factor [Proteobacteria bacterium]|nr:response regulator transcription factor [Pseudomonadota bacterium]
MKIFILEDEQDIAELIKHNLEKEGLSVEYFLTPEDFLKRYKNDNFDLLILDLMLPGMNGLEILRLIKNNPSKSHIPIIILTARNMEGDKVLGLELGADDYITKPFGVRELIARVKAVLRRVTPAKTLSRLIKINGITLDLEAFCLFVDEKKVETTKTEFYILKILVENQNKVFTREGLLEKLWGNEKIVVDRTIDVHVKRLRDKLGPYGKYLKTVRGIGYTFDMNE